MKLNHWNQSFLSVGALLIAFSFQVSAQLKAGQKAKKIVPGGQIQNLHPGRVLSYSKISASSGGLQDPLSAGAAFGSGVISVGDVDGDGILDLAAGSRSDANTSTGSAWVLLMNADGSIKSQSSLEPLSGSVSLLTIGDLFGASLSPLGDLDGDGIFELAVGAPGANAGDGSLWVVFINPDGTLRSQQEIKGTSGFGFGSSLGMLNDFDGDGVSDLAVGESAGGNGSLWMLYMNADGSEKSRSQIGAGLGGFSGSLSLGDAFGSSITSIGDLDGDSVQELAVGARGDDAGSLWVLFMNADGTVRDERKIGSSLGFASSALDRGDAFGASSAFLGNLNGDGTTALAVGAPGDDDGALVAGSEVDRGAVWILFLNADGSLASQQKISNTRGRFNGQLDDGDCFGESLSALVNFAGSNTRGLAVGSIADDDMQDDSGAIFTLNIEGFVLLDFETSGDMMTPLPNGRALNPDIAYRQLVAISSLMVQDFGPCIFDSNPMGPNDPGPDMDLLVGGGNILILQEDPTQTLPNLFDFPDDSRFGGSFIFDFTGRVELRSILILDVDSGFDEGAVITLTDLRGNQSIYHLPAGWTDDLLEGPNARGGRALDLASLDPQKGFSADATASEDEGFGFQHVIRMTVSTSSSMAVDNLVFFPFE